ncbi:MAG: LuxR C-terminal-related transcriptional regulator [Pararhodobacter sp.]
MRSPYALIGACLEALGTEGFAAPLIDLIEATGARQVMAFDLTPARALCLLSRNFRRDAVGEALAARYLDEWFRKDPLLSALGALAPGARAVHRVSARSRHMDDAYRALFFEGPGLAGKTAVLAAGQTRRLIVNLYHDSERADPIDADLAELIAHLILRHAEAGASPGYAPALAGLSVRERAVCLGMLDGKKAETIAHDLGISPATVSTYRKRAYGKLGIASRGALFALCRQG